MKKDISQYIIRANDTIQIALTIIEENSHRSVIVLDESDRVVGTLSDGDIRKQMLRQRLLSTPVQEIMNVNFIWLQPENATNAQELFQRYNIFLIPILGPMNELLDIMTAY